ncbi:MAG: hypothetical protein RL630_2219 [Verrucomicrobiota bacterium]|jgi:hypothetical protein
MKNLLPPLLPHERWLRVVCAAMVGLAFVFFALHSALPALPCGFRSLTGLPCAMCGGTRSASALLSGDWRQALYLNALSIPVLSGALLLAGVALLESMRGRAFTDWNLWKRRLGKFIPVTLLALLAWWIPHLIVALKTPKPELIDLRNPIAAKAAAWLRQ